MTPAPVLFSNLPWEATAPGARVKVVPLGKRRMRLVEFSREFVEPGWCTRGHLGMVLDGEMDLSINGVVHRYRAGDGIALEAGDAMRHRHQANVTPTVTLFLVEDQDS